MPRRLCQRSNGTLVVFCLGETVQVQINDDYYEDLTPEDMKQILRDLRKDGFSRKGPRNGRVSSEPLGGATRYFFSPDASLNAL